MASAIVIALRLVPQLLLVLVVLMVPKAVQEWVLDWEQLHPWQCLPNEVLRPLLGP